MSFPIFGIRTCVDTVDQNFGHDKHLFFFKTFSIWSDQNAINIFNIKYKNYYKVVSKIVKINRLVGRLLFSVFHCRMEKRFCRSQTFDHQCIHVKMLYTSYIPMRIDTPIIYAYCQHFHHTQKEITQRTQFQLKFTDLKINILC